jgi:hypothetical protein
LHYLQRFAVLVANLTKKIP